MLRIALELAQVRPVYRSITSTFLSRYTAVVDAMNAGDGAAGDSLDTRQPVAAHSP